MTYMHKSTEVDPSTFEHLKPTEAQQKVKMTITQRLWGYDGSRFEAYFWFVGWHHLALGMSLCLSGPNLEIHIPFGFLRIGVPVAGPPVVVKRRVCPTCGAEHPGQCPDKRCG